MENVIHYIEKNLNKNAYIKKQLLRMQDISNADIEHVKHFIEIIESNPKELKLIHVSYSNYKTFSKLYQAILKITNNSTKRVDFNSLSLQEKEKFLKLKKINYEKKSNNIIVKIKDYETTKLIGNPSWCIVKSKISWEKYNENRNHFIIFQENETYGVTVSKFFFKCYDKNNKEVTYTQIKDFLPEDALPSKLLMFTFELSHHIIFAGVMYLIFNLHFGLIEYFTGYYPNIYAKIIIFIFAFKALIEIHVSIINSNKEWQFGLLKMMVFGVLLIPELNPNLFAFYLETLPQETMDSLNEILNI